MKKRITCILFALVIFTMSAVPSFAESFQCVYDNMNLITDTSELQSLETTAKQIKQNYDIDVKIFFTADTDGSNDLKSYTEQSYNSATDAQDGIAIAVTEKESQIYTTGKASVIFTDDKKQTLLSYYNDTSDISADTELYLDEIEWILCTYYPEKSLYPRLVDNANVLSDEENADLLKKLNEISERQKFDIVVVTTNTLDGKTAEAYADDFFDFNGYGQGDDKDGALLLVSMEDRDWHVSTTGFGITAITDAGLNYMSQRFKPDLSDGNYSSAFNKFADLCDEFVTQAKNGKPFDSGNLPGSTAKHIAAAVIIGIITGFIGVTIMKSKLKSVRFQSAANNYVRPNSFNLTNSNDVFLYNTVSKVARPKDTGSSGGSSTHTSSSGTTHGGGGGKF